MQQAAESRALFWGRLRLSIIGPLLANPPDPGELRERLEEVAQQTYKHPFTGAPVRFGLSTIERWFYKARGVADPMGLLRQQVRSDYGKQPAIDPPLAELIRNQHAAHRRWTFQLLYDNVKLLVVDRDDIKLMPSYPTFVRFMHAQGLKRVAGRRGLLRPGEEAAIERKQRREVRSYEVAYVHALWHTDFHIGKRTIVGANGETFSPRLLCVTDDCSRLVCHAQWYSQPECAENLVHGLCQALQKRGVPRALMSDRGSAMFAGECSAGLIALGISHDPTAPYSPHQNGKQEVFWNQVEGRLLPMLDDCPDLTLEQLNDATQAWVEMEYQRRVHRELGVAPLTRYTDTRHVGRPCRSSEGLRQAFTVRVTRRVRGSDGTVTIDGIRFELPNRLRTLQNVTLRYARWDLRYVWVIDPNTDVVIAPIYPLDKCANADSQRRDLEAPNTSSEDRKSGAMAPLLHDLLRQYASTGLPPAYLSTVPEVQS